MKPHLFHKQRDTIPEVGVLQQQDLNDEEADTRLRSVVVSHDHGQDELVKGEHVVPPDEVIDGGNALQSKV